MHPEILVRILTLREGHHPDRQSGTEQLLTVLLHGSHPGGIRVPYHYDSLDPPRQDIDLLLCQGSPARSHSRVYPYLMQTQHIRIAFHKHRRTHHMSLPLRLKPTIQQFALHIQVGLTGIQVFRRTFLLPDIPSAEPGDISGTPVHREHHPVPESIVQGAVILVPLDQTCGQQHIRLPPLGLHILQQPALLRSIADAELRHNPIRPSSLTDIVLSPRRRLQTADKPLGCQLVHIHYLCPAVLLLPLLRCQLALLILYVQPSGKILQRLIIGHPLQMHYKADGISRLVALAETVVDILGGGHHERGGLLVVERAAALIVCALPLQLDPLVLDYLHQVGILDLVLHIRRYHTPSPLRIIDRPFRTVWHRAKGDPLSDCQKPPFQKAWLLSP